MMSLLQLQYLKEIGIDVWIDQKIPPLNAVNAVPVAKQAPAVSELSGALSTLQQQVSVCTSCSLHETRTQTVFGVGDHNADWLVIGEAPGAEEDRRGEPFVGRAGLLLNAMLLAIGLKREQVFIANILKCRPPNNRDPRPGEVSACSSYLRQQIDLIQPKIILAVGRIAAQNLLGVETPIGKMRSKRYSHPETNLPLVVTYHPAYLLRSPRQKRKVWEDLKLAMQVYREAS